MAMFGRRERVPQSRPIDAEELRRSIEEGLLIAKSAVTIAVANRIITNALRDLSRFDQSLFAEEARRQMRHMAAEQRAEADRMRTIIARAERQRGRSQHQHDYRRGDGFRLRIREATYIGLADKLEERANDAEFIDGIVATSRARAWDDIGGTVVGRLGWAQRPAAGYEIGREQRVQRFLEEDFAALVAEHPILPGNDDDPDSGSASDAPGTGASSS